MLLFFNIYVFFPFILDIKFVGRTSRGHTGGRPHRILHPPSFCGACLIFLARRIQPFLSLVDREVEFCVLTILIVLHPLGIFLFSYFFIFLVRKIPFDGVELTSQRVRGLRGTSELPGRLLPSGNPFKCHKEVLYLQATISPKRFDIFPPDWGMLGRSRCVHIFLQTGGIGIDSSGWRPIRRMYARSSNNFNNKQRQSSCQRSDHVLQDSSRVPRRRPFIFGTH